MIFPESHRNPYTALSIFSKKLKLRTWRDYETFCLYDSCFLCREHYVCTTSKPQVVAKQMASSVTVRSAGTNLMISGGGKGTGEVAAEFIKAAENLEKFQPTHEMLFNLIVELQSDPALYANGKFSQRLGMQYVDKIKAIPLEYFKTWISTVREKGGGLTTLDAVWFLLRDKKLFTGTTFNQNIGNNRLERMRKLPGPSVEEWSSSVNNDSAVALVSLVTVDALFKENEFQEATFKKALPYTKPLLKKLHR